MATATHGRQLDTNCMRKENKTKTTNAPGPLRPPPENEKLKYIFKVHVSGRLGWGEAGQGGKANRLICYDH